jgi:hypothetical protein
MPQLWQIIWLRRFYEYRPDLEEQMERWKSQMLEMCLSPVAATSALHPESDTAAPLRTTTSEIWQLASTGCVWIHDLHVEYAGHQQISAGGQRPIRDFATFDKARICNLVSHVLRMAS